MNMLVYEFHLQRLHVNDKTELHTFFCRLERAASVFLLLYNGIFSVGISNFLQYDLLFVDLDA